MRVSTLFRLGWVTHMAGIAKIAAQLGCFGVRNRSAYKLDEQSLIRIASRFDSYTRHLFGRLQRKYGTNNLAHLAEHQPSKLTVVGSIPTVVTN